MALNPNPRRALTSREIASIFSSIAGNLAVDTEANEVLAAFEHFVEFKEEYLTVWKRCHGSRPPTIGSKSGGN